MKIKKNPPKSVGLMSLVPTKAIDKKNEDDVFPSKGIILKEKDMSPLKIRYMRLWVWVIVSIFKGIAIYIFKGILHNKKKNVVASSHGRFLKFEFDGLFIFDKILCALLMFTNKDNICVSLKSLIF